MVPIWFQRKLKSRFKMTPQLWGNTLQFARLNIGLSLTFHITIERSIMNHVGSEIKAPTLLRQLDLQLPNRKALGAEGRLGRDFGPQVVGQPALLLQPTRQRSRALVRHQVGQGHQRFGCTVGGGIYTSVWDQQAAKTCKKTKSDGFFGPSSPFICPQWHIPKSK